MSPSEGSGYRKAFYRMGEVCQLTELESHVLRYWESEFEQLAPRKSRGGQRLYRPEDIELVLRIRALLHEQGFSIAGARRRLALDRRAPEWAATERDAVREELGEILTLLRANDIV